MAPRRYGSPSTLCSVPTTRSSVARKHKERNVLGYLPQELKPQVQASLRSAWQLPAKKGKARLEQQAKWLEDDYPSAAESIREGLDEMFTINELDLPASLKRCLGSTNIIESCFSGARGRTRRVTRWRNGKMVLRWARPVQKYNRTQDQTQNDPELPGFPCFPLVSSQDPPAPVGL